MNEITPLNDISSKVFDELFSRFQSLDTDALLVYLIDSVEYEWTCTTTITPDRIIKIEKLY